MADLTEPAASWSLVYQIETTDAPTGGSVGIANRHALQLMARTRYLRDMRERGLFSGMTVDGGPSEYSIKASDAGRVKNFLAGTTSFNCTIPTLASDLIKQGETVTVMNSQTEGEITLTRVSGSDDIYYQDQLISSYKIRPYCSVTILNNGTSWQLINTYERASIHGVGEVVSFAYALSGAALKGLVLCNGAAISRTAYPSLFAAVGTTFGAGDGSTTFNVPNYPTSLGGVSIRYYIRY